MARPAGISAMGREELTRVLATGKRFVAPTDVALALGVDPNAAAKKLSRWAEDGWVRRARRGLYIAVPVDASNPAAWSEDALLVAAAVWSPCYFTGWTAANHWALSDQLFRTTVLKTTKRVRKTEEALLDHDYIVCHADKSELTWGLRTEWSEGSRVSFADPARTVIDILDDPKLAGGIRHGAQILAAYLDEFSTSTLVEYGDRLGNRTIFKRLGYMTEALGKNLPDLTSACSDRISEGISSLDPDGPPGGRRVMRWHLRINVALKPEEPT